jgi:hypothetical protein
LIRKFRRKHLYEKERKKKKKKGKKKFIYICLRKKEVSDVPSDIKGVEGLY